jgi:hypothetical protein
MGRKIGSKNKNTNTAKNKNVININVNSSTSKRGKGRPRKQKQSNDTTQYRQAGGGGMMAPPQVIISQPTPQQDNSLLSSFITSRMLNESNMLNSRTSMPSVVEPPTGRGDLPSYFSARESIIPRLPETPIPKPIIKPADITPSKPIIKPSIPTPPIITPYIKPAEVAPPTTTGEPKFFKKLKDTASTVADVASSELGTAIIEHALNGIDQSRTASSVVGTALRAHRGRKEKLIDTDEEIKRNEIKQLRELHKNQNRNDMENALFNTLKTKYTGVKPRPPKESANAASKLKAATMGKLFSAEYNDIITQKRAVDKIGSAMQSKQYSNELKQFKTFNKTLSPAIKQAVTRNKYIKARDKYLDKKEGNKLNTMEAQIGYIENVVKKADTIHKENKAATTIQSAIRNKKAVKEFSDAYLENQKRVRKGVHDASAAAATTLQSALRNKLARKTYKNLDDSAPYNPQVYDAALNAAKIKKSKVLSHARTGRRYQDHERVVRKAEQSINSISSLVKPKSNAGRPRILPPK